MRFWHARRNPEPTSPIPFVHAHVLLIACSVLTAQDQWSPALTISKVLLSICSLLTDCNPGKSGGVTLLGKERVHFFCLFVLFVLFRFVLFCFVLSNA